MLRFTLISGILSTGYFVAVALTQFRSGFAFTKSWLELLAPVFLLPFLGLLVGMIWLFVSVAKRRTKPRWLALLAFPALIVALPFIPKPGFQDGMAHRIQTDFRQQEFLDFANLARTLEVDWTGSSRDSNKGHATLEQAFPGIKGLSRDKPRISLRDSYVDLFYGGPLMGHWGVAIVDGPNEANPITGESATSIEALPRIWVYQTDY